jgi:dihydropyrimidinase
LARVVEDYSALARRGAVIDYAFHLIVSDPTGKTLGTDIPALAAAGHTSLKAFMTYDRLRLHDEQLLDLMAAAREAGALVCVHAENHGLIAWAGKRLVAAGKTAPKYHAESHPRASESEASSASCVSRPISTSPSWCSTSRLRKVRRSCAGRGARACR